MPKESQDETLDGLPQFAETTGPVREPDPSPSADPSTQTSPAQPTTQTRSRRQASAVTDPGPKGTTSSPASSEESIDVEQSLGELGAGLSHLAGMVANKTVNRAAVAKGRQPSPRWLMTEAEANSIGAALGRIGARQVPSELESGDAGDLLQIGSTAIGYVFRNVAGMSGEDLERAQRGAPIETQATQTQPAPQPAQQPVDPFVPPAPAPSSGAQEELETPATQADPIIAQL